MKKRVAAALALFLFVFSFIGQQAFAEERTIEQEIIYHILVDRFNNGDYARDEAIDIDDPFAYHGGDIQGIIKKLDKLQEIGVTAISLSPIMANSEKGYHGYWIEDFFSVEEQFGTMEDVQQLVEEAHKRDMKVLLEFVINYVSVSHPWVDDAEKQDYFTAQDKTEPEWMNQTAKLNLENPEVEAYLIEAANFWIDETGIDGFLLQAADEAPLSFLKNFTEKIKATNPNFYVLGDLLFSDENREEMIATVPLDAVDQLAVQKALTEVFTEPGKPVEEIFSIVQSNSGDKGLFFVDDMYTKRFTHSFAENGRNALTVWQLALTTMFTSPGVPMLFQGSEIPMLGETPEDIQKLVEFNSGEPDLKEFYTRISALRSTFPVLQYGDFELVGTSGAMSVFKRTYNGETMYIAINNDETSRQLDITDIEPGMQLVGYLGDHIFREIEDGVYRIGLPRESAEVFSIQPDQGMNWGLILFAGGIFILFVVSVIVLSLKQKKQEQQG